MAPGMLPWQSFDLAIRLSPSAREHLRYRKTADGVVIYSVSEDRTDDGGDLSNTTSTKGNDWGVRLWDVARRRQSPGPEVEPRTPLRKLGVD